MARLDVLIMRLVRFVMEIAGRFTQSRSSGVIHEWPGVKNASAASNKISRTQLDQTSNFT